MNINKELAELLGIVWHDTVSTYPLDPKDTKYCETCQEYIGESRKHDNPDFTSDSGKIALLREMMKREDVDDFLRSITGGITSPERMIFAYYIIDNTGKLAIAARDFLKRRE